MTADRQLFAVVPPGLEPVCAAELNALGFREVRPQNGGVSFSADFEGLCLANLCLRTASRVLLRVDSFFSVHVSQLHKKAAKIPWEEILPKGGDVAVRGVCRKSKIYHSEAAAERVAKGIADRLGLNAPPEFGAGAADEEGLKTTVMVRLDRDHCTVSLDTSGAHLHRRGYRLHTGVAPLRETLAAAVLRMSNWLPEEEMRIDPMCGSGTIPIEAALLASNIAPGLHRSFAFEAFPFFDRPVFEATKERTHRNIQIDGPAILASDIDETAVRNTAANAERAGVLPRIRITQQDAADFPESDAKCLVICNPPYGKRIGERRRLRILYNALGDRVRKMRSARLAMVTDDPTFAAAAGIAFNFVSAPFPNGGIRVRLYATQ